MKGLTGQSQFIPCPFSPDYTHQKTVTIGHNYRRKNAVAFDTRLDSGDVVQSLGVSQTAG